MCVKALDLSESGTYLSSCAIWLLLHGIDEVVEGGELDLALFFLDTKNKTIT